MYYAALDIGGTKTIAAILNEAGQICEKQVFPTFVEDSGTHLDKCVQSLRELSNQMGVELSALEGIGVSLPGIVNCEAGVLIYAPYAQWENVPVAAFLSEKLKIEKVSCENDVNACAIGEQRFGLGKQYTDFVWMTVSTGVGGASVVNSQLLRGAKGFAGELGHLKVEYTKPAHCPCGQYGCLEAHGSGTALNRIVREKYESDPAFAKALTAAEAKPDGAGCAKLAKMGNQDALEIFSQIGTYLGRGMAYCVNILNTQAVIVGGGVSASLELMLPAIRAALKENAFAKMQDIDVVQTPLGYEAALLGAAALAIQE